MSDSDPIERPLVSICIVNWNTRQSLARCLQSLADHTDYSPVEILVFDNGSADCSADMVRADFPHARLIESSENIGYPRAVNRAFALCDSPLLAQVNSDVEVHAGWLNPLVDYLLEHPDVAQVAGRAFLPDGRVQTCGHRLNPIGQALREWTFDPGEKDEEVHYHSPFFVVRRKAWIEVGGFDEGYSPGYGEDAELGVELALAGWKAAFVPHSEVTHHTTMSMSLLGHKKMMRIAEARRLRFVLRNYPVSWLAVHMTLEPAKAVVALLRGYFAEYLWAWSEVWKQRGEIRRRRKLIAGRPLFRKVFQSPLTIFTKALKFGSRQ